MRFVRLGCFGGLSFRNPRELVPLPFGMGTLVEILLVSLMPAIGPQQGFAGEEPVKPNIFVDPPCANFGSPPPTLWPEVPGFCGPAVCLPNILPEPPLANLPPSPLVSCAVTPGFCGPACCWPNILPFPPFAIVGDFWEISLVFAISLSPNYPAPPATVFVRGPISPVDDGPCWFPCAAAPAEAMLGAAGEPGAPPGGDAAGAPPFGMSSGFGMMFSPSRPIFCATERRTTARPCGPIIWASIGLAVI